MIRSPGVNALITDLIDRLSKDPHLATNIANKFTWVNTNQVTVYDFYPSSSAPEPPHSLQQHHLLMAQTQNCVCPSDIDVVHTNQIFLPPSFNITHTTLESIFRQGCILSNCQTQMTNVARELNENLPFLDKIIKELTILTPQPTHTGPGQVENVRNNGTLDKIKPGHFMSQSNEKNQVISSYLVFKSHIFYLLEQWGICRDTYICNLRNDTVRGELFQLLRADHRRLQDWMFKFREFVAFCKHAVTPLPQNGVVTTHHAGTAMVDIYGNPLPSSAEKTYHVQITAPESEQVYTALGIKLELRFDHHKYHITISNFGQHAVKILEALFTFLDNDDEVAEELDPALVVTTPKAGFSSPHVDYSAANTARGDIGNSGGQAMTSDSSIHHISNQSVSTPPLPYHNDSMSSPCASTTSKQPGAISSTVYPSKHPLLRSDWLDIITVNKPLTPFPQRQHNLLASQRVANVEDVQPSFICFSFEVPVAVSSPTEIAKQYPFVRYHQNIPKQLLEVYQRQDSEAAAAAAATATATATTKPSLEVPPNASNTPNETGSAKNATTSLIPKGKHFVDDGKDNDDVKESMSSSTSDGFNHSTGPNLKSNGTDMTAIEHDSPHHQQENHTTAPAIIDTRRLCSSFLLEVVPIVTPQQQHHSGRGQVIIPQNQQQQQFL